MIISKIWTFSFVPAKDFKFLRFNNWINLKIINYIIGLNSLLKYKYNLYLFKLNIYLVTYL